MPLLSVYQSVRNCDLSSGRDLTVPLSLRLDELWRRPRGCAGGLAGRRSRFPPHPRSAVPSPRASGRRYAALELPADRPTGDGRRRSAHRQRRRCRHRRAGPSFMALTRAALSTTGPRAVLMSIAPCFMRRICSAPPPRDRIGEQRRVEQRVVVCGWKLEHHHGLEMVLARPDVASLSA